MNKKGDRIKLNHTNDPYTNLRPGDKGTVTRADESQGTIHVKWDSGSTLSLIEGEDRWTTIEQAA